MPRIAALTTCTAGKTIWPSKMLNVDPAALLVREESMELGEIAGVVNTGMRLTPAALSHELGYHFRSREVNTPFSLFQKRASSTNGCYRRTDRHISAAFEFFGPFQGLHGHRFHQLSKMHRIISGRTTKSSRYCLQMKRASMDLASTSLTDLSLPTLDVLLESRQSNVHFEKGGTINFFCGLIDALQDIWKNRRKCCHGLGGCQ